VPGRGRSTGIALAARREAPATVRARADPAMLTAKRSAKGRVHFG